jgi:hypothetical protein
MRKIVVLVVGLILLSAVAWVYFSPKKNDAPIHYHAGFRVYVDGQLQDYTDPKYMNYTMCTTTKKKPTKEDEQIDKAHLHDGVGDVVHVEQSGSIWRDLFTNIKVQLPQDKPAVGYINGVQVADIMHSPITAYSTAIFIVGTNAGEHEKEIVPIEHIKEVEAKSELCGTNTN